MRTGNLPDIAPTEPDEFFNLRKTFVIFPREGGRNQCNRHTPCALTGIDLGVLRFRNGTRSVAATISFMLASSRPLQ